MSAERVTWNMFRDIRTGKLDRQYLRICAVYRLLMRNQAIGKDRAIELLAQCKVEKPVRLVELWLANPIQKFAVTQ